MRSRTPGDLRNLCARCWQRTTDCLCATLPRVANRTDIVVLRHAKEAWRSSNTARIAGLMLERFQMIEVGALDDDRLAFEEKVAELLRSDRPSYLLFPGGSSRPKRGENIRLIVPDGNWRQARRMMLRVPGLAELPRLSFAEPVPEMSRLRTPPRAHQMSTIEAIARALEMIEGEELSRPLLDIYRALVNTRTA